jgi:ABC 2 transport system integral membrane protein
MAQRSISSEFKGTALGRVWSFINPLATIAVYALIFGVVFRGKADPGVNSGLTSFALWIGVGVIAWNFISSGIQRGMDSLVGNAGLLTKVYFPRQVLVYSTVLALAYDFAFELAVIGIVMLVAGGPGVLLMIPSVIAVTVLACLFVTGMGMVLAIASVYFRDISHLWKIFNQIWMYASGVVFSLSMLNDVQNELYEQGWRIGGQPLPIVTLFRLNPAELFLEAYRSCLYGFANPSWKVWLGCAGWALGVYALGVLVFKRFSARIVEEL